MNTSRRLAQHLRRWWTTLDRKTARCRNPPTLTATYLLLDMGLSLPTLLRLSPLRKKAGVLLLHICQRQTELERKIPRSLSATTVKVPHPPLHTHPRTAKLDQAIASGLDAPSLDALPTLHEKAKPVQAVVLDHVLAKRNRHLLCPLLATHSTEEA
jgi:hypothetical protein